MNHCKINYITNLRVVACFGVILCHVAANNWYGNIWSKRWIVLTGYITFSRFCVPLFLMISGVLFLKEGRKITLRKIYVRNILKLVIFLFFWSVCYQLYSLIIVQGNIYEVGESFWIIIEGVKNVFKGDTQAHLWYIYIIIGLYMIVPLLKSWVENLTKKQVEYFLILYIFFNGIYSIICNTNIEILSIISAFSSKLSINIVSGYTGYLILGYYLHTYDLSVKMRKICYMLGGIGFFMSAILTVIYSRYTGIATEIFWNYCSIFVIFWSASIFVFFKYNLDKLYKMVDTVADYTLGIYGCHMFFLLELWQKGLTTFSFSSVFSVPLLVVLVFCGAFCFSYIVGKLPIVRNWII